MRKVWYYQRMNLHPVKTIPIDKQGRSLMKTVIALLVGMALLAGCATQAKITWNKPGATQEEFNRDVYECTQETRVSGTAAGSLVFVAAANARTQKQANELFKLCMKARGYEIASTTE
jgi:uncharacterized lipoprotein YajG